MSPTHPQALLPGTTLGEYRIESLLGHGGFGITYLARDTRLDALYAIKEYLPRDVAHRAADGSVTAVTQEATAPFQWGLDRFSREARALAKFRHPQIARVVRILEANGTAYMVMEFEPGTTLEDLLRREHRSLTEGELLGVLLPLLDGLESLHAAGFVHRDIKPSNIYLRERGGPMLLDFGASRQVVGADAGPLTAIVTEGFAPIEQYASESQQGPWTDLYALGATSYRSLTGRSPPDAVRRSAALSADKADPLPMLALLRPPPASEPLCACIDWMLAFRAEDRPPSAAALRARLMTVATPVVSLAEAEAARGEATQVLALGPQDERRAGSVPLSAPAARSVRLRKAPLWLALGAAGVLLAGGALLIWRGGVTDRPVVYDSIAVLPFTNLSDDPADRHFVEGLHGDVISSLSKIAALKVISQTSVMEFRDEHRNLREIAAELGVATVLEGSVQRAGERVKISVQLIDAAHDQHLWVEGYERRVDDIFMIQSEIAKRIAERMARTITPEELSRLAPQATSQPAYLEVAKAHRRLRTHITLQDAQETVSGFERAIAIDPNYAPAWAGLARAYSYLADLMPPESTRPKARAALDRALALDPNLAEAHVALADHLLYMEWDAAGAERAARRALALDPNSSDAYWELGLALIVQGRYPEAQAAHKRQLELDPRSDAAFAALTYAHEVRRDWDGAAAVNARGRAMLPDSVILQRQWAFHLRMTGKADEAVRVYRDIATRVGSSPLLDFRIVSALAQAGHTSEARDALAEAQRRWQGQYVSEVYVAWAYGWLGDLDAAFEALERGYRNRAPLLVDMNADPDFDPLRADLRFEAMVRRIGSSAKPEAGKGEGP